MSCECLGVACILCPIRTVDGYFSIGLVGAVSSRKHIDRSVAWTFSVTHLSSEFRASIPLYGQLKKVLLFLMTRFGFLLTLVPRASSSSSSCSS